MYLSKERITNALYNAIMFTFVPPGKMIVEDNCMR